MNDGGFPGPLGLFTAFLSLGFVGLARNALEVLFGIKTTAKWFCLDPDVLFSMFFFPAFLCFFGAFLIHAASGMLGAKVPYKDIVYVTFCLQAVHLVIPFMDVLNPALGISWFWHLTGSFMNAYYTNTLTATVGIIFAWAVSGAVLFGVIVRRFGVSLLKALMILLIVFSAIYWPVYHLFPSLNTAFDVATDNSFNQFYYSLGSGYYDPATNFLRTLPDPYNANYFGYGFFFMFCSLAGIAYYNNHMKGGRER